jgi:hypothetical protein
MGMARVVRLRTRREHSNTYKEEGTYHGVRTAGHVTIDADAADRIPPEVT